MKTFYLTNYIIIIKDHCHVTGKSWGSAHKKCDIKFRFTNKISVVFPNLRGYDNHFIMRKKTNSFGKNIGVHWQHEIYELTLRGFGWKFKYT